ncbi:MAG: hypothetical protein G3M78_05680 [Candidatus Nitrohelix vancouverensis]|uniref:Uncharacterized protein n=1 Tax=Candidatus Nitrohelix vancouverensis TaxID=2705534 RepID=A0A7T0C1P8_9BACT|nr:MAG: hypothetical protein G3M78_05680 [Candidatus Nitrohelix vancouverensis]
MNTNYSNCICQTIGAIDYAELPKGLREVWKKCPALNKVFIHNEETLEALMQQSQIPDKAHHCSTLWLALQRGYLKNIMGPVHRYLLEGENFWKDTTPDYKKRFHETWIIKNTDAFKRHETAKKQLGSLYELLYANHLEEQGHQIISLEAWGGPADISARINGEEYDIEVKAIGSSKEEFSAVYKTLKNPDDPPIARSNPMEPVKYLMEIIRNATIQIEKFDQTEKNG